MTTFEFNLMEAVFEVWSMLMSPSRRVWPTTCKLDVGPFTSTPTPRLPVVVSITVFDEAPTKVTLSTLLKSSVPWGVAIGISIMCRGFFLQSGMHFGGKERVIHHSGGVGQMGFFGSSVTEGRSRRAWRYAFHSSILSCESGASETRTQSHSERRCVLMLLNIAH